MLVNTASHTETDAHAQYSTEPHGERFGSAALQLFTLQNHVS